MVLGWIAVRALVAPALVWAAGATDSVRSGNDQAAQAPEPRASVHQLEMSVSGRNDRATLTIVLEPGLTFAAADFDEVGGGKDGDAAGLLEQILPRLERDNLKIDLHRAWRHPHPQRDHWIYPHDLGPSYYTGQREYRWRLTRPEDLEFGRWPQGEQFFQQSPDIAPHVPSR